MTKKITTAVFPVAGMGTRFLPVTKASPKEMLPIIDKPLIQYGVEEAVAAGITRIIFVTCYTKRAIEDYFDSHFELETRLKEKGKLEHLAMVTNLVPSDVSISYVRQAVPRGLGDAILSARPLVGDEPFVILLADDVIKSKSPCIRQLIDQHNQTGASVLAVERVPKEQTGSYGIVSLGDDGSTVNTIVEKPRPEEAPSDMAVIGRYLLSPRVFDHLADLEPGAGGEIQLTDAIAKLLLEERVSVTEFSGVRYDCGSKAGWLKATLDFAMDRPDLRLVIKDYINESVTI